MLASKLQPFLSSFMDFEQQDWYEELLTECKAIVVEYGFTSRFSKIEGYHELGRRILEDNDNLERSKIYGEGVVKKVSSHVGVSERTLQYAIQFAKKFPDLNMAKFGKDMTWARVIRELLPEVPQLEKKKKVCPNCGYEL